MLYASTRNPSEVFTAYKTIHADCAPDGGLFVPYRLGKWENVKSLAENSFGQNVADVLNYFFGTSLGGWDVEFAIGRSPVKSANINPRVIVAELWHNPHNRFTHILQALSDLLRKEEVGAAPSDWVQVAVGTAIIFGIYGEYLRSDPGLLYTPVDIAVTTGDFVMPMSAWYAREMGLPIGNIVCGCNANGGVWDLLHKGEFSTGATCAHTVAPEADTVVPRDLERLICETLGSIENQRYLQCCDSGSLYGPAEEHLETLRRGMFAAVISDSRVGTLIPSVYRTNQYILGPYTALAYGSLMDYRAKTGESRTAILLSQNSPLCDVEYVAQVMKMSLPQLQLML